MSKCIHETSHARPRAACAAHATLAVGQLAVDKL